MRANSLHKKECSGIFNSSETYCYTNDSMEAYYNHDRGDDKGLYQFPVKSTLVLQGNFKLGHYLGNQNLSTGKLMWRQQIEPC
eukprot:14855598-Heterocapsa_arctica.AAC.1